MTFVPRNTSRAPMEEDAAHRLPVLGRAPELVGVDLWFNTPDGEPLRLAALRDRVVLLEFWTFACVNCQRTLPFLRRMHGQYQPDFTVVGVHSPEFAFERSVQNVERAVQEHGLEYPVGLDNEFVAWNAYGNRYWPTMYLIDRAGQGRYTQIGEGNYGCTEAAIRALLAEASTQPPRQEQPHDEVRWLRTSGAGLVSGSRAENRKSMSDPPFPACSLPSEWSAWRPALVHHRCARRPEPVLIGVS
jgi:thiol-disulfide isomerase/thioredoxin